jgi:ribose transport system permease protein
MALPTGTRQPPLGTDAALTSTGIAGWRSRDWRRTAQNYSFGFSLALVAVLMIVTLLTESGGFGLTSQLADAAPGVIAALASSAAIIGGGFDLSISPLIFFTNAAYVVWLAPHGLGGLIAIPIILGLGLVSGIITGATIVFLRVQPVVVTLAMYFALQGVDLLLAPNPVQLSHVPPWIGNLAGSVGPIPGGVITMGVPLLVWFALRLVPFRRLLFAVGSNDATAFSSGVNVSAVRIGSYALGGFIAAIGGIALTAVVSSSNASQSTEFTLTAIAAVVLGGTSLAGGRGGLIGVLFGAFAIYLLQNLLATLQINSAWDSVLYGGILIVAVVIQGAMTPQAGQGVAVKRRMLGFNLHRHPRAALAESAIGSDGAAVATAAAKPVVDQLLASEAGARPSVWTILRRLQQRFPLFQIVALLVVFAYGAITLPGLDQWISIRSILVAASLIGLASGGQTLLILMGGFDLGVSGFIVAGALSVTALNLKYHISFLEVLLITLAGASILGGAAGYICHRFRINPLVVTLATGTIAVGLVEVQNGGLADGNAPPWLSSLAEPVSKTFGVGLPPSIAIWILVVILFAVFLHRTKIGRRLLATGANPRAAEYALINTRRVWVGAFAFSAVTSTLVGVLIGGFAGTVVSTLGDSYLFQSVVAVIVGGTIFGGPGDYTRTTVGALFLTVLVTVLSGHGASPAIEDIVYGLIILVAVAVYGRERKLRDRM